MTTYSQTKEEKFLEIEEYVYRQLDYLAEKRNKAMEESPTGSPALSDYQEGMTKILLHIAQINNR